MQTWRWTGLHGTEPSAEHHAGLITYEIGGSKSLSIEEVLGRRTYSEER